MLTENSRLEIDRSIEGGDWRLAITRLQQCWSAQRNGAEAKYILSCAERLRGRMALRPYRIFVLRSFTLEPVVTAARAAAFLSGIDAVIRSGEFNAFAQEIFDPTSALYEFGPDAVFLCVQTRDIAPELWDGFSDLDGEGVRRSIERTLADYDNWMRTLRGNSNAHLIVHLLEKPEAASRGAYDSQAELGQFDAIDQVNAGIRRMARAHAGVFVLDYESLVSRHGRCAWHDELKWRTARMPIAAQHISDLANEWLRFILPLSGNTCKVLVTDLDNTLWGGLAGEEGIEGVKIGKEYPGSQYLGVQRALLDLHRRGILLAIASKNNEADALRILESHPDMLLRPEHFAAMRLNWNDKAQSAREIAEELNVGIDSLAFLDDNPAERERVRLAVPEIKVIELPGEAQGFERAIRESPLFDRLTVTSEDLDRNRQYREQRLRTQLAQNSVSLQEFYRELRQRVEIRAASELTFSRAAQLISKTNQFNLTTKRYTEQEIRELSSTSDHVVYTIQVKDRFGDNGVVGVVIVRMLDGECEIDTLLLSCRVIGRTIETAVLSFLAAESRRRGIQRLAGVFIPTKKNAPAANLYGSHGFEPDGRVSSGARWILDLVVRDVSCPEWIELIAESEAAATQYAHA